MGHSFIAIKFTTLSLPFLPFIFVFFSRCCCGCVRCTWCGLIRRWLWQSTRDREREYGHAVVLFVRLLAGFLLLVSAVRLALQYILFVPLTSTRWSCRCEAVVDLHISSKNEKYGSLASVCTPNAGIKYKIVAANIQLVAYFIIESTISFRPEIKILLLPLWLGYCH